MEHRWGERVAVRMTVELSCGSSPPVAGTLENVSSSGAFVRTQGHGPPRGPVEVLLRQDRYGRTRSVHYMITHHWSAYAQVAKGFLAPNENYFNYAAPGSTNLAPQQTWNYQAGTSWQTERMSLSADVYYIDFNNEISSETIAGQTVFYNLGGTTYKGVEAEGTYYVGSGFSVYANGSVNSAKDKTTGDWVPFAPNFTASLGAIYNLHGWYASLIDKWVGRTYDGGGQTIPIGSYAILNGALGYKFVAAQGWLHNVSIKLDFDNLLDNTNIDMSPGSSAGTSPQYPNGVPLYWTIPQRSVFATVSVPIS